MAAVASASTLDTITSDYGSHDEHQEQEPISDHGILVEATECRDPCIPGSREADIDQSTGFFKTWMADPATVLYCGKFLQAWGDRMWIFCIPILLLELHRPPMPVLFLPALYGFCSGASTIVFGPVMGDWVDHVSRLTAAKVVTVFQNGLIAIGGIALAGMIRFQDSLSNTSLYICIAFLMLVSFAANIFYAGSVVVLEKDWVGVIAGKSRARLAAMIAAVRRIELITNVLCPLVMAQVMTFMGKDWCALIIGVGSFLSIFTEYFTLKRAWSLAQDTMSKPQKLKQKGRKSVPARLFKTCSVIHQGWSTFASHPVCAAAISTAFLEATVLIFSGVTNSYAIKQGFSETVVALLAGGDALTGVVSTFLFPVARKRTSLEFLALLSMLIHLTSGLTCIASNWMPGSPFDPLFFVHGKNDSSPYNYTSVTPAAVTEQLFNESTTVTTSPTSSSMISLTVFASALTTGRLAFWMIDLAGSQIILENIHAKERGIFCAVHYSLKKLMNRLKYLLALFLSWPQVFGYLIIASQLFSVTGYMFFVLYCKQKAKKSLTATNIDQKQHHEQ